MDRVITLLCALVLAAAGMFAWDRHPPISIPVLFWHLHLPDSLATQRDAARAQAMTSASAQLTCLTTLSLQNAEIRAQAAEGDAVRTQATAQLAATQATNAHLRAASQKLGGMVIAQTMIGQPGRCDAWEAVDKAVTEALK